MGTIDRIAFAGHQNTPRHRYPLGLSAVAEQFVKPADMAGDTANPDSIQCLFNATAHNFSVQERLDQNQFPFVIGSSHLLD
jgi:hypothetical protein